MKRRAIVAQFVAYQMTGWEKSRSKISERKLEPELQLGDIVTRPIL